MADITHCDSYSLSERQKTSRSLSPHFIMDKESGMTSAGPKSQRLNRNLSWISRGSQQMKSKPQLTPFTEGHRSSDLQEASREQPAPLQLRVVVSSPVGQTDNRGQPIPLSIRQRDIDRSRVDAHQQSTRDFLTSKHHHEPLIAKNGNHIRERFAFRTRHHFNSTSWNVGIPIGLAKEAGSESTAAMSPGESFVHNGALIVAKGPVKASTPLHQASLIPKKVFKQISKNPFLRRLQFNEAPVNADLQGGQRAAEEPALLSIKPLGGIGCRREHSVSLMESFASMEVGAKSAAFPKAAASSKSISLSVGQTSHSGCLPADSQLSSLQKGTRTEKKNAQISALSKSLKSILKPRSSVSSDFRVNSPKRVNFSAFRVYARNK